MSERFPATRENNTDRQDLKDRYGLDSSAAILEAIEESIDNGQGIHKGGFISDEDYSMVTSGPGNHTNKELKIVDDLFYLNVSEENPVIDSDSSHLAGLTREEARDAAIGGLSNAQSIEGKDVHMTTVVIDPSEGAGNTGILETRMFTANGASSPRVVESFSTYGKSPDGNQRFGDLEKFVVTRRDATPQEIRNYNEVRNWQERQQ